MSNYNDKIKVKQSRTVTEKFCSRLGENAIIVTTVTATGEERKCLCADRCKSECEHITGK